MFIGLVVSAGATAVACDEAAALASDDIDELWVVVLGASSCFGLQAVLSSTTVDKIPNSVFFHLCNSFGNGWQKIPLCLIG